MTPGINGPWSAQEIDHYLRSTITPLRLACVSDSGWPNIFSLWYMYSDGQVWCATQSDSVVARALEKNPRCAFEIASNELPYRGIRGQGVASIGAGDAKKLLADLLVRYLGGMESSLARWLMSRVDHETAIRITPSHVTSWDYTERMRR
jgi:nitroimidazol reductase NimA-like FMN-containing flavoprotein (pyridoxamine 5'-phosphate oxidase superfamily)